MPLADELIKLSELHSRGSLTDEEYVRAKERLLQAEQATVAEPRSSVLNTFRRSRSDRWLGGICGGIARSTGIESWVWRLLFAVLFIFCGHGTARVLVAVDLCA